MRIFLWILAATILETIGDAVVRIALHQNGAVASRSALFLCGALALVLYGTCLNLAPVEFAQVTGIYIAILFVVFQIINYFFFRTLPSTPVFAGGSLIIAGGLIVGLWR